MLWEHLAIAFDVPYEIFSTGGTVDMNHLNHHLNYLGGMGWELVSCFDTNRHQGGTQKVICVLKRPRGAAPAIPPQGPLMAGPG